MPRAAITGRNAKVMKIFGACGMRSCYGIVGPPEGHAPRYWRSIWPIAPHGQNAWSIYALMNISSTGHADPPKAEKYPHNFAVNYHNTTSPLSAPKHFAPNDVPIPGRIGLGVLIARCSDWTIYDFRRMQTPATVVCKDWIGKMGWGYVL